MVVHDTDSRGLSWARNEGLKRATGEAVLFVDADDTVSPGYFSRHAQLLEESSADFVLTSTKYCPLKKDYTADGNAAIRAQMFGPFFGYSMADVERWNRGGALKANREQGGVWRGIYLKSFLDKWKIRFDENLRLFEDAPFIAECAARAEKVVTKNEWLYEYTPNPAGLMCSTLGTECYWQYKFAALENRLAIARRVGDWALEYFAASTVFTALEFLKARRFKDLMEYITDDYVRQAIAAFPLSRRHPLAAAAVWFLRGLVK